ncbi:MAG TPA: amylo-alpha-1,6-glucosidase [Polyangia bacterium]|nr:amylo-alpha-1,6-glucosidase [Polyangia bacterium]
MTKAHSDATLVGFVRGQTAPAALAEREWIVGNGMGGYASGTISGRITRRFHGLLVAALRNPLGRTMMLNQLTEWVTFADGHTISLGGDGAAALAEFRLELGLPVWRFESDGLVLEKRLYLPARQNTVIVRYEIVSAPQGATLSLRPAVHVRAHEGSVASAIPAYTVSLTEDRFELDAGAPYPPLRLYVHGPRTSFVFERSETSDIEYATEAARGYDSRGALWSRGRFDVVLEAGTTATFVASVEDWEVLRGIDPDELLASERDRRRFLISRSLGETPDERTATLELAADLFVISPVGRTIDAFRARARGESLRTVIAGYHWFTDWGRDTMISLEGLCLLPGRHREARWILRTFASYVRDGLVPNLFPEGSHEGLYHTADATLWFFHAIHRYLAYTKDLAFVRELLPLMEDIVKRHVAGTRFGIHVDAADGLLTQGEDGFALTWMDAKCGDWVVTPRRGKAVEINALWFNALSVLAGWERTVGRDDVARDLEARASEVRARFDERFWCEARGHLYDVLDGPDVRADASLRPNQLLAISLPHAVLERRRWPAVLAAIDGALVTPVGLRSLAPRDAGYQANYHGDLRTRDAAYHQGTVWSWLVGPYTDALLRTHPARRETARASFSGLLTNTEEACLGQVGEIFDAEPPFRPRGCVAQAWGVAELLRALDRTSSAPRAPSIEPSDSPR